MSNFREKAADILLRQYADYHGDISSNERAAAFAATDAIIAALPAQGRNDAIEAAANVAAKLADKFYAREVELLKDNARRYYTLRTQPFGKLLRLKRTLQQPASPCDVVAKYRLGLLSVIVGTSLQTPPLKMGYDYTERA